MTNDDLRLLREFRAEMPAPSETTRQRIHAYATSGAASRSFASARRGLRLTGRRRGRTILIMAAAVTVLVAAGVAIGVSLLNVTPPRFSSAPGWHVGSTRTRSCFGARGRCVQAEAWASTVRYRDCGNCIPPRKTLATLPPSGIVIQLTDARERPPFRRRGSWPPQLRAQNVLHGPFESVPARISMIYRGVRSGDGVEHFLYVWFGREHPTASQLARANAELRTVRPS
jgi:hypothetical protein